MSSFPPLPASTHPPLTGRPIPKRPARFTPDGVPDDPRFYADLDALKTSDGKPWYQTRPVIIPRICVVHTNGASREGSIQSAINWGNSATNNTKPTWQVADGRAVRLVPSNRRAIANSTPKTAETEAGVQDASYWTTAIETRDAGYIADPAISDFLDDDAELIAQILAYESLIDGSQFKMQIPFVWTGEGVVTHTWPHDKVYTTVAGKICPGLKKKATFRDVIVPRAAQIRAAWSAPEVPPPLPPEPPTETETDVQIRYTTTNREGQILIGAGVPLLLTPDIVQNEPFKSIPKIVGEGPEEDARYDEYLAIYNHAQG